MAIKMGRPARNSGSMMDDGRGGGGGRDGVMGAMDIGDAATTTGTATTPSSSSDYSAFFTGQSIWAKVAILIVFALCVLFWSDAVEFQQLNNDPSAVSSAGQQQQQQQQQQQLHPADMDGMHGHITYKQPPKDGDNAAAGVDSSSSAAAAAGELQDETDNTTTNMDDAPAAPEENEDEEDEVLPEPEPDAEAEPEPDAEADADTGDGTDRRYTYTRRGQPLSDADRQGMTEKWGSWTLVDDKADQRPSNSRNNKDIYAKYPHRDIPRSEFPPNAWQTDVEYLDKFLPEAIALVERARKAILEEYGYTSQEEANQMFDLDVHEGLLAEIQFPQYHWGDHGGWTTKRSWEGIRRRLLHAVMTEDIFVFAMGGHSASAGHGNHFQQSYTLQVQWILESVFARLGVRHQSRNFGNGGLGTIHNGLGAGSVYGPDVDFLMWDSQMTEGEPQALDTFARQALLGGDGHKVPVLWHLFPSVASVLHDKADVDVGAVGTGYSGIRELESLADLDSFPWAAQYVRCTGELHDICRSNEYTGVCWVERDDFQPPTTQGAMGGRAGWHPGNRIHQVTGRILAFTLLSALHEALQQWKEAPGYALPDDAWHVTAYYDNIRSKIQALTPEDGFCNAYAEQDLAFVCNYPMHARTEFTPRAFPELSSIRSLIPPDQVATINPPEENVYEAPDVFNPALHPPPGAIDVLNILENGVEFASVLNPNYEPHYRKPTFSSPPSVPLGKGIFLNAYAGDKFCDGSVDSFCNRGASNNCLLYGHNDGRTGLLFNGYSGWVVLNIPNVKNGFIVIKIESWHFPEENLLTLEWNSINNEDGEEQGEGGARMRSRRNMLRTKAEEEEEEDDNNVVLVGGNSTTSATTTSTTSTPRHLKREVDPYCPEFQFEYAIDGQITILNLEQFEAKRMQIQRVVETITLLKDPNFAAEEKQVEVAMRMTGCGRVKTFELTHVYWS